MISARPSDAIALAVRTGAPVFAAEEVVDEAGFVPPPTDDAVESSGAPAAEVQVEEFRAFLDSVDPEDFES